MGRPSIVTVGIAVIALSVAGTGWAWWDALSARAPLRALEGRVAGLRQEVARLSALPDLPPLPPLSVTLSRFLGTLPSDLSVKFAGAQESRAAVFSNVPNMPGVRLVVLEVSDPRPAAELPQVSLAAFGRWQARWPLQVSRAVWSGRVLVTTLTLYGR